jgi:hypothetical protein
MSREHLLMPSDHSLLFIHPFINVFIVWFSYSACSNPRQLNTVSFMASPSIVPLKRGAYTPPSSSDLRGPCPLLNSLANHGYLPRDGRDVGVDDLTTALKEVGLSSVLISMLSNPIFLERQQDIAKQSPSFLGRMRYLIRNPWALLFDQFGVRPAGQTNALGRKYINLDQLSVHGEIEHDVSITRRDFAQGNNTTIQPDLVKELLAASSDGGSTLTAQDLASLRKRRIEKQREVNSQLTYGSFQHQVACGETTLVLNAFGDGKSVPCDWVHTLFVEERLPVEEGWKKRSWRKFGLLAFVMSVQRFKKLVGVDM